MASAIVEYPLDRAQLLGDVLQKNMENIEAYIDTCTNNKLFTRQILGSLKFCQELGLFESSQNDCLKTECY